MRWLGALADRITNHAKTEFRLDDYKRADEADYSAAFLRAANENPLATTHYGIPLQIPAAEFNFYEALSVPVGTFQNRLHCIEGIGGAGGEIKPTMIFHETGSGVVHLDFGGGHSYPLLKNLNIYHVDGQPSDTSHGTGIKFGDGGTAKEATNARVTDLYVKYFDVGVEWDYFAFYGITYGLNTFYNYSAGVKYSSNYMNGHLVIGGSASQTINGPGELGTDIGASMGFIGRYREGNATHGCDLANFHVIYDIGGYAEANDDVDIVYSTIYTYWTQQIFRLCHYHEAIQGNDLPRVQLQKTRIVEIQSKFGNDVDVPPYKFTDSTPVGTWPSVFIDNEYRTATIADKEAGHVIIDQKHPLLLFSDGAPSALPVQRGTYFHNKNSTTSSLIRGYAVTSPGWIAPVPTLTPTATTTLGSKEIELNSSTTNVTPGDWIEVTGETLGGASSVMVNYVEPGISLFVTTAADTGVSGAAMAFKTATIKTDYFPVRGTFTCTNAATTTVSDQAAAVLATSVITLMPTNAAAATLMSGAKSLYVSTRTAATSFVVSTADASAAAGTETFEYIIHNT
jgi:hypothetical protein